MSSPIIHFDYDFSPYGLKTKLILTAAGVNYKKCDQPVLLPRPDLEALGITYRRIPLLAVGKDVYADSSLVTDVITSQLGKILTGPADKAYETWGNSVFQEVLGVIPQKMLTPEFVKDRAAIFPALTRPDLKELRPSAVASLHGRLQQIETGFLSGSKGPFLNGETLSLADLHFIWPILFALNALGASEEPSLSRSVFPKVYKLIESLPKVEPAVLSAEETQKAIREAQFTAKGASGVDKDDPTGLSAGTQVSIESTDSEPGKYPQVGKLVALDADEVVIEVKDGIRLRLPRIGYIVRSQ